MKVCLSDPSLVTTPLRYLGWRKHGLTFLYTKQPLWCTNQTYKEGVSYIQFAVLGILWYGSWFRNQVQVVIRPLYLYSGLTTTYIYRRH
jgi:hypothetical protein